MARDLEPDHPASTSMAGKLKRKSSIGARDETRCCKRSRIHFSGQPLPPMTITVRGEVFQPSQAFDTFWRFAAERHAIDEQRRTGQPAPWTQDSILQNHKFCNTFRILDRGCQFLVTEVIERGPTDLHEVTFRVLLFSLFTSINTYETLRKNIQLFTWKDYKRDNYERVLRHLYDNGIAIYTGAYQKSAPDLGFTENFMNHLAFLEVLMQDFPNKLQTAVYMVDVFYWLRQFKSIGDFTAYQLLLNLSYSSVMHFSEYDFVVITIGSRRGLQRCFKNEVPRYAEVDLVRWMQRTQDAHFARLGLEFRGLGPDHRPMMLCDIEHTLCELDKYIRKCEKLAKGRPFLGIGKLEQPRFPVAWSHEDRRVLRIKDKSETEDDILEKFVVTRIADHRVVDGMREFLVLWEGYKDDEATWEPEDSLLEDAPGVIKDYLNNVKARQ